MRPPAFRIAAITVASLLALSVALYLLLGVPLRRGIGLWREGKLTEARRVLEKWRAAPLRRGEFAHALAAIHLSSGEVESAPRLLAVRGASTPRALPPAEVAERLIHQRRYRELLLYQSLVKGLEGGHTFRSAALLATGDPVAAAKALEGAPANDPRVQVLRGAIADRRDGAVAILLDRKGRSFAELVLATGDLSATDSSFAPLVDKLGGPFTFEHELGELNRDEVLTTTLDHDIQVSALAALGRYSGSLVVIDVESGEIRALASSGPQNSTMSQNEPGSIVKVLTAFAALDNGVDVERIFPLECDGHLEINGRQFRDWAAHRRIDNLAEALATSCNIAFARLGIAVGAEKMRETFRRAGFDSTVEVFPFALPLGKLTGDIRIAPDYALGTFSVGLEHETTTAFHAALLAAAVAKGGTFTVPQLITARRSILGEETRTRPGSTQLQLGSSRAADIVRAGMKAVVTDARGSGRRARLDGVEIAMKTGTAGDRAAGGYDTLVIAFAPANRPRYAIGLIAPNAGPAEFAGAEITREIFRRLLVK